MDKKTSKSFHWSLGLIETLKDPKQVVKESKNAIVIKDKYPKARIHFLILPRDDIKSIIHLNGNHIEIVKEMILLYEHLKDDYSSANLKAGFHAVPSMQRLHMHVISTDFISPCLKTKQHWNTFNTHFFIPHTELLKMLIENKCIKIVNEHYKKLLNTPLQCNQCDFKPKNMPQLKQHLLVHQK